MVFDEVHYMRDVERGVVWEESIVLLPPSVTLVFLSATLSNANSFADWICHIKQRPCHVVSTHTRPTPLQHYAFPLGGKGLHLVVDEQRKFKSNNFRHVLQALEQEEQAAMVSGNTHRPSQTPDVVRLLLLCMERQWLPTIFFSFSRRECENHMLSLPSDLSLTSTEERQLIEEVFNNAVMGLSQEDQTLPQIVNLKPMLLRGFAVHHSGRTPAAR